jgi:hypothetical protein
MQALSRLERGTEPNKTTEKSCGPPPKYSYNAPIIPLYRDVGRLSKKGVKCKQAVGETGSQKKYLFSFNGVSFLPALVSVRIQI